MTAKLTRVEQLKRWIKNNGKKSKYFYMWKNELASYIGEDAADFFCKNNYK